MHRVLTALLALPIVLGALFWLPPKGWFVFCLAAVLVALHEYLKIASFWAPKAPLWLAYVMTPVTALLLAGLVPTGWLNGMLSAGRLTLMAFGASVVLGALVLLFKTPPEQSLPAMGVFCFGVPYLALPAASLYRLKTIDPWLIFFLFAIVWLGDSAAFYIGSRFGRRKLAPTVSPNKSWEGAAASLLVALIVGILWSLSQSGKVLAEWVAISLAVGVAAQLGDLVESLLKRGAGVKDSGTLLPGHGGMLDRLDALLFGAPVLLLGLWLVAALR